MIIKRIVLVWFLLTAAGTLAVFFYNDVDTRWFATISTMAIAMILLPILFLVTVVCYRYFNFNKKEAYEFHGRDDNATPTR
jgi:hypothetical protein